MNSIQNIYEAKVVYDFLLLPSKKKKKKGKEYNWDNSFCMCFVIKFNVLYTSLELLGFSILWGFEVIEK